MKKFQELCAAMMLLIFMSVSIAAGEISTGVVSPPSPPPASTTELGHITTDAATEPTPSESETLLTEITLSLLQLLSVI